MKLENVFARMGWVLSVLLPAAAGASDPDPVGDFIRSKGPIAENQRKLLKQYAAKNVARSPVEYASRWPRLAAGDTLADLETDAEKREILRNLRPQLLPNAVNALQFANGTYEDIAPGEDGYCHGLTQLIRKMNLLAMYDPENRGGELVPPPAEPAKLFQFWDDKFARIEANLPTVIPGFRGLRELSSDPMALRALRERTARLWAGKNATLGSLFEMLPAPKGSLREGELRRLHEDLRKRIELGYLPVIFIAWAEKHAIHVLQAHSVSALGADASFTIGVWDPNRLYPDNQATLEAKVGGRWTEIEIVPGDDEDAGQIAGNLQRFCRERPEVCAMKYQLPTELPPPPGEVPPAPPSPPQPLLPSKFPQ